MNKYDESKVTYVPSEARDYETGKILFAILGFFAKEEIDHITVECYLGEDDMPSARIARKLRGGDVRHAYPYSMLDLPENIVSTLQRKFI